MIVTKPGAISEEIAEAARANLDEEVALGKGSRACFRLAREAL
jgi:hypothetical protein